MADQSGERPRPPPPLPARPSSQSSESVLVPRRVLLELYELVLVLCGVVEESARLRIDSNSLKMKFEGILQRYAPGVVLEVASRMAMEKTPVEVPRPSDIERSKVDQ